MENTQNEKITEKYRVGSVLLGGVSSFENNYIMIEPFYFDILIIFKRVNYTLSTPHPHPLWDSLRDNYDKITVKTPKTHNLFFLPYTDIIIYHKKDINIAYLKNFEKEFYDMEYLNKFKITDTNTNGKVILNNSFGIAKANILDTQYGQYTINRELLEYLYFDIKESDYGIFNAYDYENKIPYRFLETVLKGIKEYN